VLSPDSTTPTAVIAVYYNIGFRIEPKDRTGFAHLFEHMMFQGSANAAKMEHIRLINSSGGLLNQGSAVQGHCDLAAGSGDDTATALDVPGREYFVSRVAAANRGGHDNIVRADASFTVRVYRQHAISLKYLANRRDAFYPDFGDSSQTRATLGIFYTWLGQDRFGAVEWR